MQWMDRRTDWWFKPVCIYRLDNSILCTLYCRDWTATIETLTDVHFTVLATSCKYYITLSLPFFDFECVFLFLFFFLSSPLDVNSNVNWQVDFISFFLLFLFSPSFVRYFVYPSTHSFCNNHYLKKKTNKQTECVPIARAPIVTYQVLLHVCIMSLTSSRFTNPAGKRWRPVTQGRPCG